ncbi:MAG TPA: carbohydrate ABC transporter permease [Firmicutes bacterium]|jgi:sn-glycerol 3-phosphate transport system permease protein|nr:carbohydrate ABC transporter permease [Bacillota bacterium]
MAVNAARKVDSAKARRRKALETAVVYGVLGLLLIIIAAPVIFALIKSTQTSQQVLRYPPMLTFGRNALSNFSAAWSDYGLGRMMLNSGFIAIVGSTGKIVTALFGALAFVYFEFPGKKLWFYFVLLTLMLPMPVIIVPLFNVMAKFGWVNTYYSLTIPYLASATGIFLFQQHFMSIPNSIVDAARMDGVGPVGFLVKILVPMSGNVVGAMVVIQFIYLWNEYLWPLIVISEPTKQVIQVGLKILSGGGAQGVTNWGVVMAGALIVAIPPLAVLLGLHEYFMAGVGLADEK